MDLGHNEPCEKPDIKEYLSCESMVIKFGNRQNSHMVRLVQRAVVCCGWWASLGRGTREPSTMKEMFYISIWLMVTTHVHRRHFIWLLTEYTLTVHLCTFFYYTSIRKKIATYCFQVPFKFQLQNDENCSILKL